MIFAFNIQGEEPGIFREGKVSSNGGTSINFPSTTDERKTPQGKVSEFFLLDNFKIIF